MLITTYAYDAVDRLTDVNTLPGSGGQTYTWDNNGSLTSNGQLKFTYNNAGRMTQAQGITATQVYTYNGDGLLINRNSARYVWDQASDLPQLLSDGSIFYVPGVGQWNGTSWVYELTDGLGSVRQLSDAQGNIVQRYDYSPFGEVVAAEGKRPSTLQYTGEQSDGDTGLIYLRARWYDPATGRFTTRDPFHGFAVFPQTQNPYVYTNNNPVNLTDPSGKILFLPLLAVAILGGLIGGAIYYTLRTITNADPCLGVQWHWQEALFWTGVGGGLGGLIGTGIYAGWWIGVQLGWWETVAGGATVAHQIVARGGIDPVRIGQEGVQHVLNLLRQAGEVILRQQAYYRTLDGRAFIDIETQNFLIEVKNLSDPTLSQRFIAQAEKYLQISQATGKPLVYYFTNQPPNAYMIEFLRRLNIIWFHTPISGGG